jgi:hypothetical protein
VTYRNQTEAGSPKAPCLGSVNEPTAEPGNLCAYRGVASPKEPEDKGGSFKQFRSAFGQEFASGASTPVEGQLSQHGMTLVFTSNNWLATGTETLKEVVSVYAQGSYAVTAP